MAGAATLTREEMEQVIRDGGSVLHNGVVIQRVQDLPSEAALSRGDPVREAQAAAALQERIARMEEELATLRANQASSTPADGASETGTGDGTETAAQTSGAGRTARRRAAADGASETGTDTGDQAPPPNSQTPSEGAS